jgi:hypothetical protein
MVGTESMAVWLIAGIGIGVIAAFAVTVFFSINTDIRQKRAKAEADKALAAWVDRYGVVKGLAYYKENLGNMPPAVVEAANREIEAWIRDQAQHEARLDAIFDGTTAAPVVAV